MAVDARLNIAWQTSLLDDASEEPRVDATYRRLERVQLDDRAWVDHAPEWVGGAQALFSDLVERLDWGQRSRQMYDKVVEEPRLTSSWREERGHPLEPAILEQMRSLLSDRYGVHFDSAGFNLYRDGRDSVAWHGDRIRKHVTEPIVALVSLGARRRFLLKPRDGGASRTFMLGDGDLLVTGGTTQRTWLHSVPKVKQADPRISIAFRHDLAGIHYVDQRPATDGAEHEPT